MNELINEIEGDFYQLSLAQEQLKFLENFAITQTISANKESIRVALEHHNAFFGIKRTVSLEDTETSLRLAIEESKGLISRFIDKIKEKIHKLTMLLSTKNGKVAERVSYLRGKMKDAEFADKKITKTSIVENFIEGKKSALEYIKSCAGHGEDYLYVLKSYHEKLTNGKDFIIYDDKNRPIVFNNTTLTFGNGNKTFSFVFKDEISGLKSDEYSIFISDVFLKDQQVGFLFLASEYYWKFSPTRKTQKSEVDGLSESDCEEILKKAEHAQRTLKTSLSIPIYWIRNSMGNHLPKNHNQFIDMVYLMILKAEDLILDTTLACLDYVEESM